MLVPDRWTSEERECVKSSASESPFFLAEAAALCGGLIELAAVVRQSRRGVVGILEVRCDLSKLPSVEYPSHFLALSPIPR